VKGFARGAPSLLSGPRRDSTRPRVGTPEVELPWGGPHEPGRLLAASRPRDAPAVRRGATPGRGDAPGRATHPRLRGVRPGRARRARRPSGGPVAPYGPGPRPIRELDLT